MTLTRDPVKLLAWRRRTAKRLPRMSAKQQRFASEFERAKVVVLRRSRGWCEARTPVCTGFGQHVHHVAGRVGPGVNAPECLLHVCFSCHAQIHGHPEESYAAGWLLRRNRGAA